MAGRPPKENSRDKQDRVRLNDEEDEMLSFCSEETGEAKSDIFRKALKAYYENAKYVKNALDSKTESSDLADEDMEFEDYDEYDEYDEYEDCDMGGISLKRAIECPYCGAANNIDFAEYSETSEYERQMGPEVEHYFAVEDCYCEECEKRFRVHGSIWEYPLGAYNYEDISVEALEDDDEEE